MKTRTTLYKNIFPIKLIAVLLLVTNTIGCSKDNDSASKEITKSSEKQITSFVFRSANTIFQTDLAATIDEENKTIDVTVPPDADVSNLLPEIKISQGATIDKTTAQNFAQPVMYMVTAEDGSTATYTITVHFPLTQRQILQAILDVNPGNTISWDLSNTGNLNDLDGVVINSEDEIVRLSIGESGITTLPKEIGLLTELTYLYLGESELREVPSEIGQLTNLEKLFLHDNFITSLPKEIGDLSSLLFLGLDNNELTSIPEEINTLTNLEKLIVSSNQLRSLPTSIGGMVSLTELTLSSNLLTELPIEIGALVNLESLFLGGNELTTIPKELGKLVNLEILSLSNNQLTSVPPELGFLINLTTLRLSENHITSLPLSVYYIKNFHNPTMTITHDLVQTGNDTPVEALIGIYTANPGNTLGWSVDHYPEVTFHDNGNPKTITMNNKNLTRIPENINRINSLETLNANNNNLESLPATIGDINTLNVITAASNNLSTVPSELGQLNNLALLSLTDNPLNSIPQEVCDLQTNGDLTLLTDPGEGCE